MRSGAACEKVPAGAGVSDGCCDGVAGQSAVHGDGGEIKVCGCDNKTHRHLMLQGEGRVDEGEATIEQLGTERMCANVLTKSLQGGRFDREVKMLTGW